MNPNTPSLLVPMNLAALCVGPQDQLSGARLGKIAADFQNLESQPYLGASVVPKPFEEEAAPAGIHLHWALPDALTRSDPSDEKKLRRAPNRFLVVRLATVIEPDGGSSPKTERRAWVVESDFVWTREERDAGASDARNALSRAVPLGFAKVEKEALMGHPLFAYQGRVRPLDAAWTDPARDPRYRPALTALGYGTEAYAAAYPHCRNVFGFFDPVFDAVRAKDGLEPRHRHLSYLVVGWYHDQASDPVTLIRKTVDDLLAARIKKTGPAGVDLANLRKEVLSDAFKSVHGWSYPWARESQGGRIPRREPERTLFVGQLTTLEWDPARSYALPAGNPVSVAIGTTTAEALSALLAHTQDPGSAADFETLLNDFQFDLVREYATAAGQASLQDALHQRDFTPLPAGDVGAPESGRIWLLKSGASGDRSIRSQASDGELSRLATSLGASLPADLATGLDALNAAQAAYDDQSAGVATRRGQVFADWTTYLAAKTPDAKSYIEKEIAALNVLVQDLGVRNASRTAARLELEQLLGLPEHSGNPAGESASPLYTLDWVTAPRYYKPNDPVVLVSGLSPSNRYGDHGRLDPGGQGGLVCRLSDDITKTGGLANLPPEKRPQLLRYSAPEDWAGTITQEIPGWQTVISLCIEATLLDPNLATLVGGVEVTRCQRDYRGGKQEDFHGVAPSPVGLTVYRHPWIPLILQWEASFRPFYPLTGPDGVPLAYPESWGMQGFELHESNPEIGYKGANPGHAGLVPTTYRGSVTLARDVQIDLTSQIQRHLEEHPLDLEMDSPGVRRMKETLKQVAGMSFQMMAQSMDGFHRQLLMRDQALQMRVFDPPASRTGDDWKRDYVGVYRFAAEVEKAVDRERDASCLEGRNHFNPIRAGSLTITRLRVLDAFGQVREIIAPNPTRDSIRSEDVIPSGRLRAPKEWNETAAVLPLRITQPARLSFRYRSALVVGGGSPGDSAARAGLEMSCDPASTPVFGWVLYNRFDDALGIYNEDGRPVGSFNLRGPVWQETPGANRGVPSPRLAEFIQHLGGRLPGDSDRADHRAESEEFRGFLKKLIATIDHGSTGIEPDDSAQDPGLAVLIGRPLALVLADLHLELYGTPPGDGAQPGLPAIDQSRAAFDDSIARFKSGGGTVYSEQERRSAGFAKVRFPVRLGDGAKVHDGLVGYFVKGADAATSYRTFHAPGAVPGGNPNVVPPPLSGTGCLSLAAADPIGTTVMMLVDPRGAVHASTGILPVKGITLPPEQYADALKRIDATFLTAPVLGGADSIQLPVPVEAGHAWSWLTRRADEELVGRSAIGIRRWTTQGLVEAPNTSAAFSPSPLRLREGWLHLYPVETASDGKSNDRLATPPTPFDVVVRPDVSGDLTLVPETARLLGPGITLAETDDGKRFIGYWNREDDSVSWKVAAEGGYNVDISYSAPEESQFKIEVFDPSGRPMWTQYYRAPGTGTWDVIQHPEVVSWRPGLADWIYAVPLAWCGTDRGVCTIKVSPATHLPDGLSGVEKRWRPVNLWSLALSKLIVPTGPRILLSEWYATLHGTKIRHVSIPGAMGPENTYIGGWTDPKEYITWRVRLTAGAWNVTVHRRHIGLGDSQGEGPDVAIEVRRAGDSQMIASGRASVPQDTGPIRVVDLPPGRPANTRCG